MHGSEFRLGRSLGGRIHKGRHRPGKMFKWDSYLTLVVCFPGNPLFIWLFDEYASLFEVKSFIGSAHIWVQIENILNTLCL